MLSTIVWKLWFGLGIRRHIVIVALWLVYIVLKKGQADILALASRLAMYSIKSVNAPVTY